jgi:predicted translin family RNA/ssDNA-binding protein
MLRHKRSVLADLVFRTDSIVFRATIKRNSERKLETSTSAGVTIT